MIDFWKKSIPFAIGMILSITSAEFLCKFVYDLSYIINDLPDYFNVENLKLLIYLCGGIFFGLVGYPLTWYGINKLKSEQ